MPVASRYRRYCCDQTTVKSFYATITSKNASENAVAVIGWDNKTVYFADQDGFTDATLVSKDKMTYIYRHVGEKDSVVAAGIMTRKK